MLCPNSPLRRELASFGGRAIVLARPLPPPSFLTYLKVDVVREKIFETVVRLLVHDLLLGLDKSGPIGLHSGRDEIRPSVARSVLSSLRLFFLLSTMYSVTVMMLLLLLLLLLLLRLTPQYFHDDRLLGRLEAPYRILVARI